jgi:gamma-glutamyltranspeptidase/glutathione hydrolase
MGVSIIQSNFHGIGAGISAGDTGVWLHNRGAGFTLEPGHPNRAAPGKRPMHTLSPTLWSDGGSLRLLLGTRGGHQQPQYLVQAAALLFGAGLAPAEAQAVPRWSMDHAAAGTTSRVMVEARTAAAVRDGLAARGHHVETHDDYRPGWGPVSIIAAEPGGWQAAADPRVSTAHASVGTAPGAAGRSR